MRSINIIQEIIKTLSEKQNKSSKILISYDLERRVGNVIPVGGEPIGVSTYNDIADDTISGTAIVAAGATRISVASIPIRRVTVLADAANAGNVLISNINPMFPLVPGAAMTIVVNDISKVWCSGVAGDLLHFLAERF